MNEKMKTKETKITQALLPFLLQNKSHKDTADKTQSICPYIWEL